MKTGRITAKLRDAVPVCLMAEGKEVKRYKNIELPDSIKEVELLDFHFNVPADGKITFEIHYASGICVYCCTFIVSTIDSCPILLIGRRIANAAEPKHNMTIRSRGTTGSCQVVPHLSAIRNWNIILFNGNPSTHPVTHPKTA